MKEDERVIRMVGLCIGFLYTEDGIYARIIALVVDEEYRKFHKNMGYVEKITGFVKRLL